MLYKQLTVRMCVKPAVRVWRKGLRSTTWRIWSRRKTGWMLSFEYARGGGWTNFLEIWWSRWWLRWKMLWKHTLWRFWWRIPFVLRHLIDLYSWSPHTGASLVEPKCKSFSLVQFLQTYPLCTLKDHRKKSSLFAFHHLFKLYHSTYHIVAHLNSIVLTG